jgi:hypothetical protein
MDAVTRQHFNNLNSSNNEERYASFQYLLQATDKPVKWTYEVWNDLLNLVTSGDNHQRAIAAQLLSNLAKSDTDHRLRIDFDKLLPAIRDERFVTARHSLQSLWKVGVVNKEYQKMVIDSLSERFADCVSEKNCTLIRYDILEVFKKIYDQRPNDPLKDKAIELIESEADALYRKKYIKLWRIS